MLHNISECLVFPERWRLQRQRQRQLYSQSFLFKLPREHVHAKTAVRVWIGQNTNAMRRQKLLWDESGTDQMRMPVFLPE